MTRQELQKAISLCQSDEDFEQAIRIASMECNTKSLGKQFFYYGEHEYINDMKRNKKAYRYETGYKKIDQYAQPRAGKCTLIPAYTHHGKSVFAMNLCYNMWNKYQNTNIIFYSFESDCYDVMSFLSRLWYYYTYEAKQSGENLSISEWDRLRETEGSEINSHNIYAVGQLQQRIFVQDRKISAEKLGVHLMRVLDDKGNVGIVFIDYLQDMEPDKRTGEHHADVEQMMIDVERIASEYHVAVIIPAQYKRPEYNFSEKSGKKNLIGEHRIYGSSSLSKKADVIYSLFNSTMFDYHFKNIGVIGEYEELEVDILKARRQSYAKNLTFKFCRRTGRIFESSKVICENIGGDENGK